MGSDVSGQSRTAMRKRDGLLSNMVANVLGQFMFVLTGFVVPRLLYDAVGKELLGVWDFGWSMVAHLMLVGGGMMSAVTRDVAHHTGREDYDALSATINTCWVIFTGCAALVVALGGLTAWMLPWFIPTLSAGLIPEARWVLLLLSASIAVRFSLHVFNGVITGSQRYVLQNTINGACFTATVVLGVGLVKLGYSLSAMAAVYILGELVGGLLKLRYARQVNPHWRLGGQYVRASTVRRVFSFGGKTVMQAVSRVLLYQTNTMLVGRYMGAEAIAMFSRPRSLVFAVERLMSNMGVVFVPRASELQARGDREALRRALKTASEYSLYVSLPCLLTLAILGEPIMRLWMGKEFALGAVLAVLAVGHLATNASRGTYAILMGMGLHGAPAAAEFVGALAGIALAMLAVGHLGWGLMGAALAIVIPSTIVNGVYLPMRVCAALEMPISRYLLHAAAKPLMVAAPAALAMLAVRLWGPGGALGQTLVGIGVSGPIYGFLCWRLALNDEQRRRIAGNVRRVFGTGGKARGSRAAEGESVSVHGMTAAAHAHAGGLAPLPAVEPPPAVAAEANEETSSAKGRLAERGFWDARHSGYAGERRRDRDAGDASFMNRVRSKLGAEPDQSYPDFLITRKLASLLPRRPEWKAIEVGCAPGRNLMRMHRMFGYQPYGVDYSPVGAETTRETFRRHGFDPGNVMQCDFFDPAFQAAQRERFDVVHSAGFIEHFDDPRPVVEAHANLLKPGGYLVCSIPNLRSYVWPVLRLMANDLLNAHNRAIMRRRPFAALFDGLGLTPAFCEYIGVCQLFGVALRHERGVRGVVARVMDRFADALNHGMFLILRGRGLETAWSPHLLYIGRKAPVSVDSGGAGSAGRAARGRTRDGLTAEACQGR
ncbi:MAG: hypothetical protein CHACPFDD_03844 [Phycisphaerae bacterium]|nr:hypothetical protein [Phycisphaerae bacterium]